MFSAFCEIPCARTRRARSYALKPLVDLRHGSDLARKALDLTPATSKDLTRILRVDLMALSAHLDLVRTSDYTRDLGRISLSLDLERVSDRAKDLTRRFVLRVDLRHGLDLAHIIAKDLARILLADLMRGLGAGATVTTPATTAFARRVGHINPALSIAGYNFQGDLARLKLRFKNA